MKPSTTESEPQQLREIYRARFEKAQAYRHQVWSILCKDYFQKWISPDGAILDLGCGYGEFINQIIAKQKFGMDLNPDSGKALQANVTLLSQDCSQTWPLEANSLDCVFTSNFFEHLPDK